MFVIQFTDKRNLDDAINAINERNIEMTSDMMYRTQENAAMRHELITQLEEELNADLINDKDVLAKAMAIVDKIRVDYASFDEEVAPLVHTTVMDINHILVESSHRRNQ